MVAAATLTTHLISTYLQIDPLRLSASTGHRPNITIISSTRPNYQYISTSFHQRRPSTFSSGHLQMMMMCTTGQIRSLHVVKASHVGMNCGDDYWKRSRVVGASVVVACVIGAMCLTTRPLCRPALANQTVQQQGRKSHCQQDKDNPPGGMMDWVLTGLEPEFDTDLNKAQENLEEFARSDFMLYTGGKSNSDLQKSARTVALKGDVEQRKKILDKLIYKYNSLILSKDPQKAHVIGLVIVDVLICQKKYDEAETALKCLLDFEFMNDMNKKKYDDVDARIYDDAKLYMVVISIMRGAKNKRLWQEYTDAAGDLNEIPKYSDFVDQFMSGAKNKRLWKEYTDAAGDLNEIPKYSDFVDQFKEFRKMIEEKSTTKKC